MRIGNSIAARSGPQIAEGSQKQINASGPTVMLIFHFEAKTDFSVRPDKTVNCITLL